MNEPAPPLRYIALGLVVVLLDTPVYDWLPDFLGWLIILLGLRQYPDVARRNLLISAAVAAIVALVLWFPQVHEVVLQRNVDIADLSNDEASLRWALLLPDYVFIVLLMHSLYRMAGRTQPGVAAVFLTLKFVFAVGALVTPIAVAAGEPGWIRTGDETLGFAWIVVLVLLFWVSGRDYAKPSRESAPST